MFHFPNDLNHYIAEFLIHPDTEIRLTRAIYIVKKLHMETQSLLKEVKYICEKRNIEFVRITDGELECYSPLLLVQYRLEQYLGTGTRKLLEDIDKIMFFFKHYGTSDWYCRRVEPFIFKPRRINLR